MPKIGDLFIQIGADSKAFTKELKTLSKSIEGFGQEMKKVGSEFTKALTIPLAGFAGVALASSRTAQSAFKHFAEQTQISMGKLGDEIFRTLNLQGVLNLLESSLASAVKAFSELSGVVKAAVLGVAALAAAIGPAFLIMGNWAIITAKTAAAVKVLGAALTFLSAHPIAVVVTGIAAVVGGLYLYQRVSAAAAQSTKIYGDSLLEVQRRLKAAEEDLESFRKAGEGGNLATEIKGIESEIKRLTGLINDSRRTGFAHADNKKETAGWRAEVERLNKRLAEARAAFNLGLGRRETAVALETSAASTLTLTRATETLARAYRLGGTEAEFLQGKIRAITAQRDKLLETPGTDEDQIRSLNRQLQDTQGRLEQLQRAQRLGTIEWRRSTSAAEEFLRLLTQIPRVTQQMGPALINGIKAFGAGIGRVVTNAGGLGAGLSKSIINGIRKGEAAVLSTVGTVQQAFQEMLDRPIQAQQNIDQNNRMLLEQFRAYELIGGGINLVNAELDTQIQNMLALEQSGQRGSQAWENIRLRIEELQSPLQQFIGLMQTIPPMAQQIGQLLFTVVQEFTAGVGQAIANAIVFSQNLGKALVQVLKQIAANIIATLIQIGIQRLLLAILGVDSAAKDASANIGSSVGRAGAAAVAASIESLGLIGLALAPGFAAAAIAAATAAGAAGIAAGATVGQSVRVAQAAESALFTKPSITTIAEREPEIALTKSKLRSFLADGGLVGTGGGNTFQFVFTMRGRTLAEALVPEIPGVLRYHGITI